MLFEPVLIGGLALRNRLMRSATAESMFDPVSGEPLPALGALYEELARGGVGLIVTGHVYVDRAGKAHPEMGSLADDAVIPAWRSAIGAARAAGARVMAQINHAGANGDAQLDPHPLSPSGVATNPEVSPRAMTCSEVEATVRAFGRAAWRAREAGFDGVEIHGAHGYLVSQFLTPWTNLRQDCWGAGGARGRLAFLEEVIAEVRRQVGDDYPVWIKLGVSGARRFGFTLAQGQAAAAACRDAGVGLVEISHALGRPAEATRGAAPFLPLAQGIREVVGPEYPLALVNGLRSMRVMERLLATGVVQLVSLSRPLIAEPDLPSRLAAGQARRSLCVSCGACWPRFPGEGIGCHNAEVQASVRQSRA